MSPIIIFGALGKRRSNSSIRAISPKPKMPMSGCGQRKATILVKTALSECSPQNTRQLLHNHQHPDAGRETSEHRMRGKFDNVTKPGAREQELPGAYEYHQNGKQPDDPDGSPCQAEMRAATELACTIASAIVGIVLTNEDFPIPLAAIPPTTAHSRPATAPHIPARAESRRARRRKCTGAMQGRPLLSRRSIHAKARLG